jgi:hypothetical protein
MAQINAVAFTQLEDARKALIAAGFAESHPAVIQLADQLAAATGAKVKVWVESVDAFALGLREKVRLVRQKDSKYDAERLAFDLTTFQALFDGLKKAATTL